MRVKKGSDGESAPTCKRGKFAGGVACAGMFNSTIRLRLSLCAMCSVGRLAAFAVAAIASSVASRKLSDENVESRGT